VNSSGNMSGTWELLDLTPRKACMESPLKACMESWLSTVQVESEQWTVHSLHQSQLQKKKPPSLPHPPKENREVPSLHDTTFHWLHWKLGGEGGCRFTSLSYKCHVNKLLLVMCHSAWLQCNITLATYSSHSLYLTLEGLQGNIPSL
jgi:hypothetical protein